MAVEQRPVAMSLAYGDEYTSREGVLESTLKILSN